MDIRKCLLYLSPFERCLAECRFRLDDWVYDFLQPDTLHTKGLTPVWTRKWTARLCESANCLSHPSAGHCSIMEYHTGHPWWAQCQGSQMNRRLTLYFLTRRWTLSIWRLSLALTEKALSHSVQPCDRSPWDSSTCLPILPTVLKDFSQPWKLQATQKNAILTTESNHTGDQRTDR